MADTIKLAQGSATLDINDGSTYAIKRIFLSTPADKDLWHVPDYGESQLVRTEPSDRPCTIDMAITAADEDTLQNDVVVLRRWLKNEAKRAELDGDTDSVYLTILKNGGTNTVKHRIKNAYVDDSASHYTGFRKATIALHITIHLVLAPYGEWDTTITLRNDMFSSPHMLEDSNSDGLADGWAEIDGAETTTIDTTDWLIGGQSQKVVAGADNFGIQCDTITNAADTSAVGFVWIYVSTGAVDVHLYDADAPGVEDSTDATSGNADKTTTADGGGNTWLRIVVSSDSIPAGNDVRIQVLAKGGAATFYVDGTYLELGTTTAPDSFASAKNLDNRGDIQSTNQASENYLNYMHVWGVPGDAPALLETRLTLSGLPGGGGNRRLYIGRSQDGNVNAGLDRHWLESDDFAEGTSPSGASGGDDANIVGTFTGTDAYYISYNPKHIYGIIRVSNTQADITLKAQYGSTTLTTFYTSDIKNAPDINEWYTIDFGVVRGREVAPMDVPDTTSPSIKYTIEFDNVVAAGTCDVDAVLLLPTSQEKIIFETGDTVSDGDITYIRGEQSDCIVDAIGHTIPDLLGTFWEVTPNIANKLVFATTTTAAVYSYTQAAAITLVITPRTRHLMGT
jgi:hypothetical protein